MIFLHSIPGDGMSKNAHAFFTFRPGDGIPSPGRNVKSASASTLHGSNVEERADSSEREIGDSCEREIRAVGVILFPTGKS